MADISKIQLSDNTQYNLKDAVARSALTENDTSTGDISKIQLSDNTQYNIKDAQARQDIETVTTDVKAQVNADKDLINNGTAFISNETVDDYDDKIEEMQEAYKKFIPIQTVSGTEITLDNSSNDKALINIGLDGNAEQFATTGLQLLKYPYRDTTKTQNGITFTDLGDGTIKVNGTATANCYFYLTTTNDTYYKDMSGQTLRLVGCPSGGSNSTYRVIFCNDNWVGGIDVGSGSNFTVQDTYYNQSFIQIYSGTTCNNLIFKPMLTKTTSATINDYEPYTGRNSFTKSIITSRSKSGNRREYNYNKK